MSMMRYYFKRAGSKAQCKILSPAEKLEERKLGICTIITDTSEEDAFRLAHKKLDLEGNTDITLEKKETLF